MLLTAVVTGHNCVAVRRAATCSSRARFVRMFHPSTYDDALCVNASVEVNVLDYNVAVRCRPSTYGDVRRCTQCERGYTSIKCFNTIFGDYFYSQFSELSVASQSRRVKAIQSRLIFNVTKHSYLHRSKGQDKISLSVRCSYINACSKAYKAMIRDAASFSYQYAQDSTT